MKLSDHSFHPLAGPKLTIKQRVCLFLLGALGALLLSFGMSPAAASRGETAAAAKVSEVGTVALLPPHAPRPPAAGEARDRSEADGNRSDASTASTSHAKANCEGVTKRIPDQKVLLGRPSTVIDLAGLFDDTAVAKDGGPLTYEVLNKPNEEACEKEEEVASAQVVEMPDGPKLILKWGDKTGCREVTIRVTNVQTGRYLHNRLTVEVWEADYRKLLLTVVGGLGIFLLGMKSMSEGLQAVAGAGLRRMISAVTDNRLLAVGVGTGVTMLIQSSSITTVMVVGFVNSGLMTLSQAVGVIMGANIGTTITGWILVMQIGMYGLPILGFAAFIYLFSKRDRVRYLALATMGLGMVFFGLELMKDGFSTVKNLPEFYDWFQMFPARTYLGVLGCASVGCVLTLVVQSSSATLGITISLVVTGVVPFETGAALVLGENIGTTITAFLASFGATTNAKRAAYFHMLFNTFGVIWITAVFLPFYMPLIKSIIGTEPGPQPGTEVVRDATEAIALTHSLFNVANMLLFLPFVRVSAAVLERIVPQRAVKEKPHLTNLDVRMLETSVIAIEQSRIEVLRMAFGCKKLMAWIKEILPQEVPDQKTVQKAFHREEVLDTIQDEIVAFMAHLLSGNLPHDVADEARRQLRMADEYESISDYLVNVLKSHLKLQQAGLRFPEEDAEKLMELHDLVADYLELVSRGYEQRQPEVITKAHSQGHAVTLRVKELRDRFLAKMSDQKLDPQVIVAYTAQLNFYRRVREHALNIAEAMAGEK